MTSEQPTAMTVAQSLEGFGDLPHAITEGMDASACPFLTTAAELGLEGESLYRVMRAMMAVFSQDGTEGTAEG